MSTTNEYRFGVPSDTYIHVYLCVCVLNEMKMYECDELLEWLVYSSKWEALLTDNILSMAAVLITIL